MAELCNEWARKEKVDLKLDFITSQGCKLLLTIMSQGMAESGHDILPFPTWFVAAHHRNLSPVDDIMEPLIKQNGNVVPLVEYLGKHNERWLGVPSTPGSMMKDLCARVDLFKKHVGLDQVGAPTDLYNSPATKFVAGFIGSPAMNFVPCRLEQSEDELRIRLNDDIAFPVPADRVGRDRAHLNSTNLVFGLRPEHIFGERQYLEPDQRVFESDIEVTEEMGMDTLICFSINGAEVCGRVSPKAGARPGGRLRLFADLNNNMHLMDDDSGAVL
jgi:hypothetical protein